MAARPSPAQLGFRIVADARPAARYWLAWPKTGAAPVVAPLLSLAATLSDLAPVTVLADPATAATASLRLPQGVGTMAAAHDGMRLRPKAPLFLRRSDDGALAALVNPSSQARAIVEHLDCPIFAAPPWLRSDFVDADGTGTLLASMCMLEHGPQSEIEAALRGWTGSEQVVWLDTGLAGNDGSLAAVARALSPGVVMASVAFGEEDRGLLEGNRDRLREAGFTVIGVPTPMSVPSGAGLPASYTAAVVTPGDVILPAFEEARDDAAALAVATALPTRRVSLEPARELLASGCELSAVVVKQPMTRL